MLARLLLRKPLQPRLPFQPVCLSSGIFVYLKKKKGGRKTLLRTSRKSKNKNSAIIQKNKPITFKSSMAKSISGSRAGTGRIFFQTARTKQKY